MAYRWFVSRTDFKDPGLYAILLIFLLGLIYTLLEGGMPSGEDAFENFMIAAAMYGGGLSIFYSGFSIYRKLQLIRNTPTSKIKSMAMGTVELKGEAHNGTDNLVVKSPFSGKECLFYKYTVEEYRSSGKHSRWVQIDQGRDGVRFLLQDETSEVIVDPEGAELEIPIDNTYSAKGFEDAPPEIQNFIERNESVKKGSNEMLSVFSNKRRYREWYVTPGEEVYVFGYATKETDENGEYEVVKNDNSSPLFMISDKSEKELRNSKSLKYKLMIVGGALAAPSGLALMFLITGIL